MSSFCLPTNGFLYKNSIWRFLFISVRTNKTFFWNRYTSCRHQKHGKKRVNIDCTSLIIHCCIQYLQDTFRFVMKTAKYHYKKEKKSRYSRKHLIAIMMFVTKRKGLFRSTKANLRVEILRKIIWVYIDQSYDLPGRWRGIFDIMVRCRLKLSSMLVCLSRLRFRSASNLMLIIPTRAPMHEEQGIVDLARCQGITFKEFKNK